MDYDIASAFEDIEMSLIKSMRNNMKRHINEEYDEGINWTQWQAEMLSGLSQYRAENKDVLKGYMGRINAKLDEAIRDAYATGESEQEIELLKAIKRGYQAPKDGRKAKMQGRFFRNNQKKLNALVKSTTDDMKKAETALLRMTDDVYRQTLFKAQMFYNTGAGSMWQCIDMATKDFRAAGINCVQYKNGARVNIASYAEMALRTANKRANLMGQAQTREKWGVHTVKINYRGIACPICLQYLGQVYIDDVYGGGTYEESVQTGYPLLSTAVAGGLFHPNCKDACSTFYEGINRPPEQPTPEQEEEIKRKYNLEQEQRYYERNYKRNMRMGNGCLDQQEAGKYFARANQYKNKLIDLCDNNPDVLRLDKARLSLRGVLSVDNVGRLSITPQAIKNANMGQIQPKKQEIKHTEAYNKLMEYIKANDVEYLEVKQLDKKRSIDEIIALVGGADRTDGSCASLGFAYAGQRNGLDVLDFRDGKSRITFANHERIQYIASLDGVISTIKKSTTPMKDSIKMLNAMKSGKEYYFTSCKHAAIVRKTNNGILQYLELQSGNTSGYMNGWHDFNAPYGREIGIKQALNWRFSIPKTKSTYNRQSTLIDIESLKDNDEFRDILGYINTATDKQVKGEGGYAK